MRSLQLTQQPKLFSVKIRYYLCRVLFFNRAMGNCLVLHKKVIKIIKSDGGILECKPPMTVHHVLSKFGGHAISDTLPVIQHLHPDADMIGGRAYYLLPLLAGPPQIVKTTVKNSSTITATGQESGVLRIKLIISKQELQAMLQKGKVTVDDMVSKLQTNGKVNDPDSLTTDSRKSSGGWMPVLESIPEGNQYTAS